MVSAHLLHGSAPFFFQDTLAFSALLWGLRSQTRSNFTSFARGCQRNDFAALLRIGDSGATLFGCDDSRRSASGTNSWLGLSPGLLSHDHVPE